MPRLFFEVDVAVVAHACTDAPSVAKVFGLAASGTVIAACDGDHATPRSAAVRDAREVHSDFDIAPLLQLGRIVNVHARHGTRDLEDAVASGRVARATVVCVEPAVVRIDAREGARYTVVPFRNPVLATGNRGIEHRDPKL